LKGAFATSAYPIIFNPVEYNDMFLVDGGLVDNIPLPSEEYRNPTDITIAVILCSRKDTFLNPEYAKLRGIRRKLAEGLAMWELYTSQELIRELRNWDESKHGKLHVVEMKNPEKYFGFDFSNTDELIQLGYDNAMEILQGETF